MSTSDDDKEPVTLGYAPTAPVPNSTQKWVSYLAVIVVAALCFALIMPSLRSARSPARRSLCASNVGCIARACLVYAEENRGSFPPSLEVLLEGGPRALLTEKQLICPSTGKPNYVYIPGLQNTLDPRNVLVYEPIGNHENEGGNIAFLDGHVKWLNAENHANEVKKTRERLGHIVLPMVTTQPE